MFVSLSRYVDKIQNFTRRKELQNSNSKLEQLNEKLNCLTFTDALSTLNNRRYFDKKLIESWDTCINKGCCITIIMVDIDNFKNFNDVYGHQTGDDCIFSVATVLKNSVNETNDIVVRYGGEEFTVILIYATQEQSEMLANKICKSVADLKIPNKITNREQYVTISLGVYCETPNKSDNATEFVEKADKALYMAKQNGKNQVKVF